MTVQLLHTCTVLAKGRPYYVPECDREVANWWLAGPWKMLIGVAMKPGYAGTESWPLK
ncbi:MAG: hypothetical protein IPP33_02520 [Flavobacteriales bacterium]|nr:hypothetical protein [Flavobacteriales bacterium]